jgi:predicted Zn-dependent protease
MSGGSLDEALARMAALRAAGQHDEHLAAALALAARHPSAAVARLEAAFALDRAGDEAAAIRHYDAAWQLGVPDDRRRRFVVGYGSTLRNVGRVDEAVVLLTEEVVRDPDYPPFSAFLALALHSAGHGGAALATMLSCLLDVAARAGAGAHPLDGYQRALGDYYRELVDESTAKPR